jgi:hypothetical protein
MFIEKLTAKGHGNILAKHPTTFEITKDSYLTKRGDCIIGISANKSMVDFSENFKERLRRKNAKLEITLRCSDVEEKVIAYGDPELTFKHSHDMVIRKSNFICDRTLAIKADKSARDLKRDLVEKLKKNGKNILEIELKISASSSL